MKQFLIGLCFLGLTSSTFAQENVVFKTVLKKEKVPTVILEAVDVDFPDFVITEFATVPIEFVEDDVYVNHAVDPDDVDTYQISMEGKGKMITATYSSNGKLLNTVENLKNVTPPLAVERALVKAYPGWIFQKIHTTCLITLMERKKRDIDLCCLKTEKTNMSIRMPMAPFLTGLRKCRNNMAEMHPCP